MADHWKARATTPGIVDEILEKLGSRKGLDIREIVQDRQIILEIKQELAQIVYGGIMDASDDAEPGSIRWDPETLTWVDNVEEEEEEEEEELSPEEYRAAMARFEGTN